MGSGVAQFERDSDPHTQRIRDKPVTKPNSPALFPTSVKACRSRDKGGWDRYIDLCTRQTSPHEKTGTGSGNAIVTIWIFEETTILKLLIDSKGKLSNIFRVSSCLVN